MKINKYGMKDYYKFFKQNYPEINISRQKFNDIISSYNKELVNYIIENLSYKLPFRLGKIEIVKSKRGVYIDPKTGKVKNNIPVDWKATKKLWQEDTVAKDNKTIIRYNNSKTGDYVFQIYYNTRTAIYKNKTVYKFKSVRSFSRLLAFRINDYGKDNYDSYLK